MPSSFKHHDAAGQAKRREAAFERWRSEVLREAGNPAALARVKARVLAARDLLQDPELLAMVRNFIAEREGIFHRTQAAEQAPVPPRGIEPVARADAEPSVLPPKMESSPGPGAAERLKHLTERLHDSLAHFALESAQAALAAMEALLGEFPGLLDAARFQEYAELLGETAQRCRRFRKHLTRTALHAVMAARHGDDEAAERAFRRLSSVHAMFPALLPDERFQRVQEQIARSNETHARRVAVRELLARERAVAGDLQRLASVIHRFHRAARALPHDSRQYANAEAEYRRAVAEVKSHETEWLAGLILELVQLLEEIHGPPGQAQQQVDHFIASVQATLVHLRRHISEEQTTPGGGRAP